MKKKAAQKVKATASKSKTNKPVTSSAGKAGAAKAKAKPMVAAKPDAAFTQAVQNFEAAVKAMQERKFDKAKANLEKVVAGPHKELADRARQHLRICEQQAAKSSTSFRTPEEHYDYAISVMNSGDYDTARSHFEKILKQSPKSDYVLYGQAVLSCLTGQVEEAITNLRKAIELNPRNRFQARNDSDFAKMSDDPRFTELVYPEG